MDMDNVYKLEFLLNLNTCMLEKISANIPVSGIEVTM